MQYRVNRPGLRLLQGESGIYYLKTCANYIKNGRNRLSLFVSLCAGELSRREMCAKWVRPRIHLAAIFLLRVDRKRNDEIGFVFLRTNVIGGTIGGARLVPRTKRFTCGVPAVRQNGTRRSYLT